MKELRERLFDVIVVGGGPAGCHVVTKLARPGRSVLLLDKQRFPRWKPCAGGITSKTAPYLCPELRGLFECTMHGAFLTYGDRLATHIRSRKTLGWTVHRQTFDRAHLDLARALPGVTVRECAGATAVEEREGEVVVDVGGTTCVARAVVGADGVNSIVSRAVPGHESRAVGAAFEGEARFGRQALSTDAVFDFRCFRGGYGWVFPKKDHYSVGGYFYGQSARSLSRKYDEFCRSISVLDGCVTYRTRGYRVPHGGGRRHLNTRRILLIGDAADLVDPLTGEGIYYAFRSAHLAAPAIEGLLERGDPMDTYSDQVWAEMHSDLRYAGWIARCVYSSPRLFFSLLFRNRLICRWFVDLLTGERSYREVLIAALVRLPILPFYYRFGRMRTVTLD